MIWTCNSFTGFWPVGTAAVVRAATADEASTILADALRKQGLPQKEAPEMEPFEGDVAILCDGDY